VLVLFGDGRRWAREDEIEKIGDANSRSPPTGIWNVDSHHER
jgi:hypothetical protein